MLVHVILLFALAPEAEERETRYSVQTMTGAIGAPPEARARSVVMTKQNGRKYCCYLPLSGDGNGGSGGGAGALAAGGEAVAGATAATSPPSVSSLLHSLRGSCFFRIEGWWTCGGP